MAHCVVKEAEQVLDKEITVLDRGFVRLVDYMGGDERIVASARVSYGKGTKTFRQDRGLIHYLLRNDHTSPFEQVVFTFHAKMPIFVARQWIRHRTARVNEISGRYSVLRDEFYVPDEADVAYQSDDNKQGRSAEPAPKSVQRETVDLLLAGQQQAYADYQRLIGNNIARELARINLPLSLYTEWYWQIDLNNLFHFLRLRMDPHAQREIRAYADAIHDLARKVCPIAFEAFDDHIKGSVRLSSKEAEAVRAMLKGEGVSLDDRERRILAEKLNTEL
ncbi:MAG: FAD-dependent thymidylate synthase [Chitinivibrionales bacterium]|nr:FAD-dependent thymidylate synthase [Chitinivibrionales bacterium]